jgi:hypothetical protein
MVAWLKSKSYKGQYLVVSKQQRKGKAMAALQSHLDEFKKAFESGAPPYNVPHEAIEIMHRATTELKTSGLANQALKVGDRAPQFSLFNQDHVQVNSRDLPIRLDLAEVSFIDRNGINFLHSLPVHRVVFVNCSGFTSQQLRWPNCEEAKRN